MSPLRGIEGEDCINIIKSLPITEPFFIVTASPSAGRARGAMQSIKGLCYKDCHTSPFGLRSQ